ncbi:hypothetical protein [Shewanella sp. TC10]|uniref:hypothetical protein n=1 Tax=Shewanella sp. TC10 TaxID=1419739 RepID=UPI00129E6A71|nr:hypothetical protein [Shewanella sp. TC10]
MFSTIMIWIVLSVIVGMIGSTRKIGFFASFLASLIFSPLIGLLICVASQSNVDKTFQESILKNQEASLGLNSDNNNPEASIRESQEKWEQAQTYIEQVSNAVSFLNSNLSGTELDNSLLKLKKLYETLGEDYLTESNLNKIIIDIKAEAEKHSLELKNEIAEKEKLQQEKLMIDEKVKAKLKLQEEKQAKIIKKIFLVSVVLFCISAFVYGVFQLGMNLLG